MWRGVVAVVLCVALSFYNGAAMAAVTCAYDIAPHPMILYHGDLGGNVHRLDTDFDLYVDPSYSNFAVIYTAPEWPTLGVQCTSPGVKGVYMTKEEYQMLIDGAVVVQKLQEGYDIFAVALAAFAALAGFGMGYKAVQRKDSQ